MLETCSHPQKLSVLLFTVWSGGFCFVGVRCKTAILGVLSHSGSLAGLNVMVVPTYSSQILLFCQERTRWRCSLFEWLLQKADPDSLHAHVIFKLHLVVMRSSPCIVLNFGFHMDGIYRHYKQITKCISMHPCVKYESHFSLHLSTMGIMFSFPGCQFHSFCAHCSRTNLVDMKNN